MANNNASIAVQSTVHVTIDGEYLGRFDAHEGGETTAEIVKHRDGGSPSETLIPVPATTEMFTVRRLYKAERDQALRKFRKRVGRAAPVVLGFQDMDADMNAYGAQETFTGLLAGFKVPDGDSSSNDKRFIEIKVEVETS